MNNLHIVVTTGLQAVNASSELRNMIATKNLDDNYRLEIINSYKQMKKHLLLLTIISSILICIAALISAFFTINNLEDMLISVFTIAFVSIILVILFTLYIMNHSGKKYIEARRAYRKGILGLSREETAIRLNITEDEKQCLKYFKKIYTLDCILFLISIPIAIVIGYFISSIFESYFILLIILVVDIIYFMVFRIDSSNTEVHRLSTGYYRIPQKKTCFKCQKDTPFLVHSSDSLFCMHCGTELKLESWEKASHKMHKKVKWLIDRR